MKNLAVDVIAITGGKGGVGKTQAAMNLSIALSRLKQRVLLFDADFGLCNIDVLWGLKAANNLSHVVSGQKHLRDIIIQGPENIQFIPSASGVLPLANMSELLQHGVMQQFSELEDSFDTLIIDTAAGISHDVLNFVQAANVALIVLTDEPTSMTDAYALIKVLKEHHGMNEFHILCNQVDHYKHGHDLFTRFASVCDRFCPVDIKLLGVIPTDSYVKKAVQMRTTCLQLYPSSRASKAYMQSAKKLLEHKEKAGRLPSHGNLSFFSSFAQHSSSLSF